MKSNAAIIIVNWNGEKFLKNCLSSVYKQTYKDFDVYFVDNGSIDNSVEFVKKNFPRAKIIKLDKNYGFAKSNNEGIKEALKDKNIEYIICLNNDTIVDKNWLEELIKIAKRDEKIGGVASKAYFIDGKTIQNAGLAYPPSSQINRPGKLSVGYGLTDKQVPNLNKEIEIFAPGGVAALYKRAVLEKLFKRDKEIFDEDFFAYGEDVDLGFRIRFLNYYSVLAPKAKLIHLHSQTGGKASSFKAFYSERNSILIVIKNFSLLELLIYSFRRVKLSLSYMTKNNESVEKLKKKIGFFKIICLAIKANLVALKYLPRMLFKRYKIQRNKKITNKEISLWFNKFSRINIENINR
jgi:GT2 family glycosyltransferase